MADSPHTSAVDSPGKGSSVNVVITGVGVVSPIGIGAEAYWESLCAERSGVVRLPGREQLDLPMSIGGAIPAFDPKQYVKPRKALKVMCREIQTGFAAAGLAVEQSQLPGGQLAPERFGVVFGSEMLYSDPSDMQDVYQNCIVDGEFKLERWGGAAMAKMYPLWMLMYLPNMIACHVGIAHDARGPNNTICQGDVSSLLAMVEAASVIRRGQADVMLAGGSSSRIGIAPSLYRGMEHLSNRIDEPAAACRPFDARRDGAVNGEGAAVVVLENEDFARARGAKILARLGGWGLAFGSHAKSAHGEAIARSVQMAIASSGLTGEDIGHLNAHASGLVDGDAVEAQAIEEVLGDVPVIAPKSFFGDAGAAGGALELVASLLAIENRQIPVTLNYGEPDAQCPVNVVHDRLRPMTKTAAVIQSQASTGQAVAVVLDAP